MAIFLDRQQPQRRVVDYTFISEDGEVVQQVLINPPAYGELNLQPERYEVRLCRLGILDRGSGDNVGRVVKYKTPILEEDFAYSAKDLREKLERRSIPWLSEFEEVMGQ